MKIACVFLASGLGKRFGGNKLLTSFLGKTLIECVWDQFPTAEFSEIIVVTRYDRVAEMASKRGYKVVWNTSCEDDISLTIRAGIQALHKEIKGCMFSVCDQPYLQTNSLKYMIDRFREDPQRIVALGYQGKRGNPVLFPCILFTELENLEKNHSGVAVISRFLSLLDIVEAETKLELQDIDLPE